MRSAKTKKNTHYQPQNLQVVNHTSKQTITQSSNQNYGQFHAVKRGSRYWYFTWFSGQVLFADRTANQCKNKPIIPTKFLVSPLFYFLLVIGWINS